MDVFFLLFFVLNLGYQTDEEDKTGVEEEVSRVTSREEKRERDRERERENESEKYVSSIEKAATQKRARVFVRGSANIMASETTLEKNRKRSDDD